jgi:hypothetical protein
MWLKKHRAQIEARGKVFVVTAYAFFWIGYVLDVLYNYFYGSIMFAAMPAKGDWTLSARLERIRENPLNYTARQRALADFFCEKMLNPYDPSGKHC